MNCRFKKLSLKTRKIVTIFLTAALLFSHCISYAFESSTPAGTSSTKIFAEEATPFKVDYNKVYQFMSDHEYLFVPLSGALAGGVGCGAPCAILGGLLGALDEALVNRGHLDKHYLTWMVFGATTGLTLKSRTVVADAVGTHYAPGIVGAAFGILLPTGMLNEHKEVTATVALATLVDPITGIGYGLDELSIASGFTDKHYLTFVTLGRNAATKFPRTNNLIGAGLIGLGFALVAKNYEGKIQEIVLAPVTAPTEIAKDLYENYGKFIPKEHLNPNIEKLGLSLIGNQFLVQFIVVLLKTHEKRIENEFHPSNEGNLALQKMVKTALNFVIVAVPYITGQATSERITSYFNKKTKYFLEDQVRSHLFSNETALCLPDDPETRVLTDNLRGDISTITKDGSKLINDAISSTVAGIYGLGTIMSKSPKLTAYAVVFGLTESFVASWIAEHQRYYEEKITPIHSEINSIIKFDAENMRTIAESDGIEFTKIRIQKLYDKARVYEAKKEVWSSMSKFWKDITKNTNTAVNYYLVGSEIIQNRVPFADGTITLGANQKVSDWVAWSGHKARDISSIYQSLNRINKLDEKIDGYSKDADDIARKYNDDNQLSLSDFEIKIKNDLLVAIDDLNLDMGKAYAITGDPGSGKTNLLFKIKGVGYRGIYGKGQIDYPLVDGREPKIIMLSQQNYLPNSLSLQQIIAYPNEIPNNPEENGKQRENMRLLLKEIGLWKTDIGIEKNVVDNPDNKPLNLDSVENWHNVLSGGEKKKISIVSAIMKKPDILILDETFDSLGPSVAIVQKMLKKYLPNALILAVDHYAHTNNFNGFYDKELHFINKRIVSQEILPAAQQPITIETQNLIRD